MLSGRWMESSRNSVKLDMTSEVVTSLVQFCYNDELPSSTDLIGKLLVISDRLFINSLRLRCEAILGKMVYSEKCSKMALKLFSFSLQTTAQFLAMKCARLIAADFASLLETGGLDQVDGDDLEMLS